MTLSKSVNLSEPGFDYGGKKKKETRPDPVCLTSQGCSVDPVQQGRMCFCAVLTGQSFFYAIDFLSLCLNVTFLRFQCEVLNQPLSLMTTI